jgi:putative SOS response-associated peptidase YedK
MPGRFVRSSTNELLCSYFGITFTPYPWAAPNFNVAPQTIQPIIRLNAKTHKRELAPLRWGLIPSWARDVKIGLKTINARAEGIETKPSFSKALKERRCLIPADGYYEWQQISTNERQPFCIALKSREPLAFAGLWERALEPDGSALETFTVITTSPNELIAPIHHRMPVILAPQDYESWLRAKEPPLEILRPFDAAQMQMWPVSDRVGNVRNNDPSLFEPITPPKRTLFD